MSKYKCLVEMEFATDFQKNVNLSIFNLFMDVMSKKMSEGHKRNKFSLNYNLNENSKDK